MLDDIIRESGQSSEMISHTLIDAECSLREVNHNLLQQISMLAPFGCENPEPVLCARNLKATSPSIVGCNHLRLRLSSEGTSCNAIWFGMGKHLSAINGANLDIAFSPQINYWNGSSDIQLKLKDVAINQ